MQPTCLPTLYTTASERFSYKWTAQVYTSQIHTDKMDPVHVKAREWDAAALLIKQLA